MTRYRPGDQVFHGARRGEVVATQPCGYSGHIVRVYFDDCSDAWIMADELSPVVERLRFRPRVVGGTDMEVRL